MSTINTEGMLVDGKVILQRCANIEHGEIDQVSAIVVHQTDSSTAEQTLNGYKTGSNGAHFLIDKNGQIYQSASMLMRCFHVGKLIKSKCVSVDMKSCDSASMAKISALSWTSQIKALDAHERAKSYPQRYPVNSDSIGIELVGKSIDSKQYESVTGQQNVSLQWLIGELYTHFTLKADDVYRHPDVSYKNPGEASSAVWK